MKTRTLILLTISILFTFCACSNKSNINNGKINENIEKSTMTDTNAEKDNNIITVKIGNKVFSAQLYDNETAKAFYDMLPLTFDMNELHGNEKYFNLKNSLPTDSTSVGEIRSGDIMLYGNNCLVLFYDSFSTNYSYTKIGSIETSTDLAETVGSGDITITFEK